MRGSWHVPITNYQTYCLAAGMVLATVKLRRHYLGRFAIDNGDPYKVTRLDVQTFLGNDTWKPETRKSASSAVKSFYAWAVESGHIEVNPCLGLKPVRIPPGQPKPIPEAALRAAMDSPPPRVRLMLALGAYAGLRRNEIAELRFEDVVDTGGGAVLVVRGKGGVTRHIPLHPELDELREGTGYVFSDGRGGHLSADYVGKLIKRALPKPWTAHCLRHRFATQVYAGTNDLLAVQKLLGHSRPETTQRYTLVDGDRLRAAVMTA